MQRVIVESAVFALLGLAYAVFATLWARRFGPQKPMTWYVFLDRYGFSVLLFLNALASFLADNTYSVADIATIISYILIGVFGVANIAATIVRGRELQSEMKSRQMNGADKG